MSSACAIWRECTTQPVNNTTAEGGQSTQHRISHSTDSSPCVVTAWHNEKYGQKDYIISLVWHTALNQCLCAAKQANGVTKCIELRVYF